MGIIYSLLVAVANRPMASLALTAELAAASPLALPDAPLDEEVAASVEDLLLRLPTTPPTTAPMMTRIRTGTPNLIQLLVPFLRATGVMKPDDSL